MKYMLSLTTKHSAVKGKKEPGIFLSTAYPNILLYQTPAMALQKHSAWSEVFSSSRQQQHTLLHPIFQLFRLTPVGRKSWKIFQVKIFILKAEEAKDISTMTSLLPNSKDRHHHKKALINL